ncbi:copper resistance protein CopC [Actinomadura syzygii]|uniref:Copper resistance protein CopC n=1 Tax=Actinomadura syzygii TaxID=1427538 RepID=A0A5D0U0B4_9ACTN|nr:copper resistance protein CopC [Actinomadura syzygii]TYC11497.1 copper resistance protein CopC [Actinomadura syzygii]
MNILKTRRPLGRLALVAALTAALGAVAAPPALAHTRLVSSTPAKGATMPGIVKVTLVFSDKIRMAKVIVKDDAGKTYEQGPAEHSGSGGTEVVQNVQGPLPAGKYTVAYRVVGADGHAIEGDGLTFTSSGGGSEPSAPPPSAGGVGAEQQTGQAATTDEQPLKIDQQQAAEADKKDSGSNMLLWGLIIGGLVVGVGVGVGIVFRAKRKHPAAPAADKQPASTGSE